MLFILVACYLRFFDDFTNDWIPLPILYRYKAVLAVHGRRNRCKSERKLETSIQIILIIILADNYLIWFIYNGIKFTCNNGVSYFQDISYHRH